MFLPMLVENCLGDFELNKKVVFEAKNLCINAVRDDGSELPIVKDANFKVRDCLLYTSPSPRDGW